jgi:hypothetical protein
MNFFQLFKYGIAHQIKRKKKAFFIRQSLGMTVKCSRIENFLLYTASSSISRDKEGTLLVNKLHARNIFFITHGS